MSFDGRQGLIGFAVKGVAGGIGLASEGVSALKQRSKDKKARAANADANSCSTTTQEDDQHEKRNGDEKALEEGDEAQWKLDDAQDEIHRTTSNESLQKTTTEDAKKTMEAFILRYPLPSSTDPGSKHKLALPVIIPQRRPKARTRGFIRAYAPALEPCGIDQAMFLDFLDTFHTASAASPWIQAINLASLATNAIPSFGIGIAVSVAIKIGTDIATEMQGRYRTNITLTKINDSFFRPRGLYCLIMTYDPYSSATTQEFDLNSTFASKTSSDSSSLGSKMRSSSGKNDPDLLFPEAAPLIFPALDNLADQTGEEAETTKVKLVKAGIFVDDYWDRRAQAKYSGKHPGSVLAQGPKPKFASRYADPNHPASSGNLWSLVSGGHFNPQQYGARGRGFGGGRVGGLGALLGGGMDGDFGGLGRGPGARMRGGYGQGGYPQKGYMSESEYMQSQGGQGRGYGRGTRMQQGGGLGGGVGLLGLPNLGVGVKRLLGKDVLYLMIVPMPSDEEMAAAMNFVEQKK